MKLNKLLLIAESIEKLAKDTDTNVAEIIVSLIGVCFSYKESELILAHFKE